MLKPKKCQKGVSVHLITISRKNSSLSNLTSCSMMEPEYYVNVVIHFSVSHGGRSDINQHLQSQKHKDAEKVLTLEGNIGLHLVRCGDGSESGKITAAKAATAYHTVHHGQSLCANDCLPKLIKNISEPKFSSTQTKSQAVVCNVLGTHIMAEVIEDLNKTKSITLSLDASNKRHIKLFPIS